MGGSGRQTLVLLLQRGQVGHLPAQAVWYTCPQSSVVYFLFLASFFIVAGRLPRQTAQVGCCCMVEIELWRLGAAQFFSS